MNFLWQPEIEVSEQLAIELIQDQFPTLPVHTCKYFGVGWDNTAFLVNDRVVFRFPRREIAVSLIKNECILLPLLQNQFLLPIPDPLYIGVPSPKYHWPFAGYEKLHGNSACMANLNRDARCKNASAIAEFLATLHQLNYHQALALGVKTDTILRVDPKTRIPKTYQNLDFLDETNLFETTRLRAYLAGFPEIDSTTRLCLTHGDLYVRHLLVDNENLLCGIIDWGDAELGHPAVDLAIAHSFLPPEAHDDFRAAYGEIDSDTWELARLRGIYSASTFAHYAYTVKDENLLREGLLGLSFMVSGM